MGKSGRSNPRTSSSSTSHSSPSYTSQALALHNGMGGPHPSATQTVQPINVAGEIADMPYRDNPPARSTRGPGSHRLPLPESPHSSGSNSGSGSSGAATPLQYSPPTSSGHAQAQGLHMGMAWAQPHRTQPKPRHRMDPIRQPEAEGIPDFGRGPREWALCGLCEP
ncbi:hypothetical protein V496_01403 [Pseudogymnoascus sp. VKM F-4515 (FW-2607)]|nr:hypothetical protein V496_01403 [Pseudogymnoascus sp. VKM F-4515 (FW-2607)]